MKRYYIIGSIILGVTISLSGCENNPSPAPIVNVQPKVITKYKTIVKYKYRDVIPPFPVVKQKKRYPSFPKVKPKKPKSIYNAYSTPPWARPLPNCSSFRNAVNNGGLTTETGERLTELSGCQRQRRACSIERCILTTRCTQVLACIE